MSDADFILRGRLRVQKVGDARVQQERLNQDMREYAAQHPKTRVDEMTSAAFESYVNDPTKLVIIAEMGRPGVYLFSVALEYEVFPPKTALNRAFELAHIQAFDMTWAILVIPMTALDEAQRIAQLYGMVVVDGVPVACYLGGNAAMMGTTRPGSPAHKDLMKRGHCEWFPIRGENARTLENAKDSTPPAWNEEEALTNWIRSEWEQKYGIPDKGLGS